MSMDLTEGLLMLMGYALGDGAHFVERTEAGEIIAPFAIVRVGEDHDYRWFEAESQTEALESALEELTEDDSLDGWALVRDGLMSNENGTQTDVIIVEAWERGLDRRLMLVQPYLLSAGEGGFSLAAPSFMVDGNVLHFENTKPMDLVWESAAQNPRAVDEWANWTRTN